MAGERSHEVAERVRVFRHTIAAVAGVERGRAHHREQQFEAGFVRRIYHGVELAPGIAPARPFQILPVDLLANPTEAGLAGAAQRQAFTLVEQVRGHTKFQRLGFQRVGQAARPKRHGCGTRARCCARAGAGRAGWHACWGGRWGKCRGDAGCWRSRRRDRSGLGAWRGGSSRGCAARHQAASQQPPQTARRAQKRSPH